MTKETLAKAKLVASHLTSGELHQLRSWCEEMANKKWKAEGIAKMKAWPVGARVVLGNIPGWPAFSAQAVTIFQHRRKYVWVKKEDGAGLMIPYTHFGSIKGLATDAEAVNTAEGEAEINRTLAPLLNSYLEKEGLAGAKTR
ncbi:MAG: hypothetical protein KGI38_11360 [Thaumarchaeota archaeon]|nr:hypothetical protein [Nitrososphaerota archaeon]